MITNEQAVSKLSDLLDANYMKFNTWECEFLDNIQYNETFTDGQKETIEKLWHKNFQEDDENS